MQGNARMTSGGPQCQHGPVECQMNKRMSCFKHFHSKQSDLLQYAACSEGHSALDIDSAADKCIKALGFNVAEIHTCEAGELSLSLGFLAKSCAEQPLLAHCSTVHPWHIFSGSQTATATDALLQQLSIWAEDFMRALVPVIVALHVESRPTFPVRCTGACCIRACQGHGP